MEKEGEASASSPFAPRAALVRTPPHGFATPSPMQQDDMALTPAVPSRQPPPRPPPPTPPLVSAGGKRPLTSPEERRPSDLVRMCRPTTGSAPAAPAAAAAATAATASAAVAPTAAVVEMLEGDTSDEEDGGLSKSPKGELIDLVHRELRVVMSAVTGPTSRLNKDATNAISSSVHNIMAVVATLSLRLSEQEVELSQARLTAARAELEAERASKVAMPHAGAAASTFSYASALKLTKAANPVPIPAAQGPVLAFYPAPEHAAAFKTAEETKAELKRAIRPQDMQVQVDRVRKVGNAGVVVQTTSEASAEKLKKAVPAWRSGHPILSEIRGSTIFGHLWSFR